MGSSVDNPSISTPYNGSHMAQQSTFVKILFASLLTSVTTTSSAQWQWKDDNGRMVYSDRPPPTSVLPSQMVRVPAPKPVAKATDKVGEKPIELASASKTVDAKSGLPVKSLADKDLESKKKAQDAEKAEAKRATDATQEAKTKTACADTRSSLNNIESGARISKTNAKGEREVMEDDEKAKRAIALKKDIAEHCKN